jgi:hypothetical protein
VAGQIDASQQQDALNSTLLNALKAQGLTDDQANQALSTFQALSGANGGPNMLDQGPSGNFSYTPQDATQQSAYDNALNQTGSTSIASQVASIVATKEAFDSYVANNSVPASVQATFTDALLSEDVYFNQSIPELLAGTGYSRVTDPAALSALGVNASQFSDSKSGFYAALYEDSDTGSYVLADRGTVNLAGWAANASQALGYGSKQYAEGINLASTLANNLGDDLSFTGHSLGGGLAAAEAVVTGLQATVFDPSGVNEATIAPYGPSAVANYNNAQNFVHSYDLNGEFLGWFDDQGGKYVVGYDTLGVPGLAIASQIPGTLGPVTPVPAVNQNGQSISTSWFNPSMALHGLNYMIYGLNSLVRQ